MFNFLKKQKFGTGALEDQLDLRDYKFDEIAAAAPAVDWDKGYDVEKEANIKIPIKNQNGSSSCVGQGWSYYIAILNAIEIGSYNEVSAKAIYSQIALPQGGAYIKSGGKLTVDWGSVMENIVPSYDNGKSPTENFVKDLSWRSEEINKTAKILQAKEYRVISNKDNMDNFAVAIRDNYGVVGGLRGENNATWSTNEPKPPKVSSWAHCFVVGSQVLTKNGYKDIQNIQVNDYVLTHKNRFKKVTATGKRQYQGDVYEIDVQGGIEKVVVTSEHPFYCVNVKKNGIKFLQDNNKLKYNFKPIQDIAKEISPRSPSMEKVRIKSGCVYQNSLVESAISDVEYNQNININKAFLLGAYLGDGNLIKRNDRDKNAYYGIRFSLGINDRKILLKQKIITLMKQEFNVEPKINKVKGQNNELVIFYKKEITDFFAKYCGTPNNKKINSSIYFLSKDILFSFLDGWYQTDGCYESRQNKKIVSTSERNLAYSLTCILNKLQIGFSTQSRSGGTKKIQGREVQYKKSWHFSFRDWNYNNDYVANWFDNGYKLVRPKTISKHIFNGDVYNLEVEDDNSYTVNNLIVHNCLYYGKYGIDKLGKYIATPNSWGTRGTDTLHPDGWQKLREDYVNGLFQFNPWTLVDKPNQAMSNEADLVAQRNEKKVIIEAEGAGRKGIIINGKLRQMVKDRESAACLYTLTNNGMGIFVSTNIFDKMQKAQNF